MPEIGDIVISTEQWREETNWLNAESHPHYFQPGIVVATDYDDLTVRHLNNSPDSQDGTVLWSEEYLELVHALNTPEARAIHESYPQYQGRDYNWYLEQRGVFQLGEIPVMEESLEEDIDWEEYTPPAETVAEAVPRPFQVGDVAVTIGVGGSSDIDSLPWDGRVCTLTHVAEHESYTAITGVDERGRAIQFHSHNWQLVSPAPAPVVAPASWREWQAGDVLRRVNRGYSDGQASIEVGQEAIIHELQGTHFKIKLPGQQGMWENHRADAEYYEWVRRPGTIPPPNMPITTVLPPEQWQVGDILRRVAATAETSHVRIGEELAVKALDNPRSSQIKMDTVDPARGWWVPKVDLEFVSRPGVSSAQLAAIVTQPKPIKFPCMVDVQDTTPEQRAAFEAALKLRRQEGYGVGYSTYEGSPHKEYPNRGLALGHDGNRWLYHKPDETWPMLEGGLMQNWNRILLALDAKNGKPASQLDLQLTGRPKAMERTLGLYQLPPFAVLECKPEFSTQQPELFATLGFTTTPGRYQLLANNSLQGTDNKGVALAFQQQHQCLWLKKDTDQQLLHNLFTKRKASYAYFTTVTEKTLSPMRFALDVAASTTPLITAFKALMAHLGYRQENTSVTEGPYILLNGGGLFTGQDLTWQYAPTYNKRRQLLSLAAPNGWEHLCERLKEGNVARPVDTVDELDAVPQAGDSVVLIDTTIKDSYPETELDMSYHSAGKMYTISSIHNSLAMLKETGLQLHVDRLMVAEKPRGISSGDTVTVTMPFGDLVKEGNCYTYTEKDDSKSFGVLVDSLGTTFAVPPTNYVLATEEQAKNYLLCLHKLALPLVARITNPASTAVEPGSEVVFTDCWMLSNKRLGFWMESDSDKGSYYELDDFQVVSIATIKDTPIKVYKGSDEVTIDGKPYSRKELEEVLATAYA